MTPNIIKEKLLNEINHMSDANLSEAYKMIKFIRSDSQVKEEQNLDILSFSGAWGDMKDETFTDLMDNIANRRDQAFTERRNNAISIN